MSYSLPTFIHTNNPAVAQSRPKSGYTGTGIVKLSESFLGHGPSAGGTLHDSVATYNTLYELDPITLRIFKNGGLGESEYRDSQLDSVTVYDKERSNMNMTEFLLHSTNSSGVGNSLAIFNYDTAERVLNALCDMNADTADDMKLSPFGEYLFAYLTVDRNQYINVSTSKSLQGPVRKFISKVRPNSIGLYDRDNTVFMQNSQNVDVAVMYSGRILPDDIVSLRLPADKVFGLDHLNLEDCTMYEVIAPLDESIVRDGLARTTSGEFVRERRIRGGGGTTVFDTAYAISYWLVPLGTSYEGVMMLVKEKLICYNSMDKITRRNTTREIAVIKRGRVRRLTEYLKVSVIKNRNVIAFTNFTIELGRWEYATITYPGSIGESRSPNGDVSSGSGLVPDVHTPKSFLTTVENLRKRKARPDDSLHTKHKAGSLQAMINSPLEAEPPHLEGSSVDNPHVGDNVYVNDDAREHITLKEFSAPINYPGSFGECRSPNETNTDVSSGSGLVPDVQTPKSSLTSVEIVRKRKTRLDDSSHTKRQAGSLQAIVNSPYLEESSVDNSRVGDNVYVNDDAREHIAPTVNVEYPYSGEAMADNTCVDYGLHENSDDRENITPTGFSEDTGISSGAVTTRRSLRKNRVTYQEHNDIESDEEANM